MNIDTTRLGMFQQVDLGNENAIANLGENASVQQHRHV